MATLDIIALTTVLSCSNLSMAYCNRYNCSYNYFHQNFDVFRLLTGTVFSTYLLIKYSQMRP
jgi:hypothetical protein